jgi:hypothetical protein
MRKVRRSEVDIQQAWKAGRKKVLTCREKREKEQVNIKIDITFHCEIWFPSGVMAPHILNLRHYMEISS